MCAKLRTPERGIYHDKKIAKGRDCGDAIGMAVTEWTLGTNNVSLQTVW